MLHTWLVHHLTLKEIALSQTERFTAVLSNRKISLRQNYKIEFWDSKLLIPLGFYLIIKLHVQIFCLENIQAS